MDKLSEDQKNILLGLKSLALAKLKEADAYYDIALKILGKEDDAGWVSDFMYDEGTDIETLEEKL